MHYLFFLIVGQLDVDMYRYRVMYGRAFIDITITQLHKPMMSQFDDPLIICYGKKKFLKSFKKFELNKITTQSKTHIQQMCGTGGSYNYVPPVHG